MTVTCAALRTALADLRSAPRQRSQRGQMAGLETIPLGILVFIAGTLVVVNGWAVVSTRSAADSIAREYLRAYTQAATRDAALQAGGTVASVVVASRDLPPDRVHITAPTTFGRCAVAEVTVAIDIPAVQAPYLGGLGAQRVSVTHRDRVDAYTVGVEGPVDCGR